MGIDPRAIQHLLVPLGMLCALLLARPQLQGLDSELAALLPWLPYGLFAAAGLLAAQFRHLRLVLLALLSVAAQFLVQDSLQAPLAQPEVERAYHTLALAAPLACLVLLLLPGAASATLRAAAVALFILGLLGWLLPLLVEYLMARAALDPHWLQLWPREDVVLSRGLLALHGLVLSLGLLALLLRQTAAEAALVVSLGSISVLLAVFHLPGISTVMLTAAGLAQVLGAWRCSQAMLYRDELTGLLGRRAFNAHLRRLWGNYAVAMLDIDHFKKLNDNHGHDVGDEVLKLVASRMRRVGGGGVAYRYGGEEFAVVFSRGGWERAQNALEALREDIANYEMVLRDRGTRAARGKGNRSKRGATRLGPNIITVTISLGLARRLPELRRADDVLKAADQQLYRAKQRGRNRLCALGERD